MNQDIKKKLKRLPLDPGVYIFKNSSGSFLYIGKAKVLKNRVRSYFQKRTDIDPRIQGMLIDAEKLDWIKTDSEIEALLLEAEMIKRYKPRYNIDLRDDKSYQYIGITWGKKYPRVVFVRQPDFSDKKVRYFGPYTSSGSLKEAMKI